MNGNHNNNQISAKEILRYLGGQMDRREMHAFERAVLDDDMLADAIEGYKLMRETLSDEAILGKVNQVNEQGKRQEKENIPIIKLSLFRWAGYAVAASFVIAAGWWVFNISRPEEVLPLQPDMVQQGATKAFDSIKEDPSSEKSVLADVAQKEELSKDNQGKTVEGGNNRSAATTNKKYEAVKKDIAGVQSVPSTSADYPAISKDRMSQESVMAELRDSGNFPPKRMIAADAKKIETPALKFQIADTTIAAPSMGWPSYQNYLKSNFTLPASHTSGLANIFLDKEGKIIEVEIEGNYTNAEKKLIADLIKNGPAWKNSTAKPAKMVIQW